MGNRINNVALVKATDPAAFRWLLQGAVQAQKAAQARKVTQGRNATSQRQIELQRLARELAVLERSVRK